MLLPARVKMAVAGVTVAGGAVAAALLGTAGPAVGQVSQPVQATIQVVSPATLVAKGAGVDVLVTAECSGPLGVTATVSVGLTERSGSDIAVGSGGTEIGCTGTSQTVQVLVTVNVIGAGPPGGSPGSKAFKRGTAIAQADIQACTANFSFCGSQQVEPTIAIN